MFIKKEITAAKAILEKHGRISLEELNAKMPEGMIKLTKTQYRYVCEKTFKGANGFHMASAKTQLILCLAKYGPEKIFSIEVIAEKAWQQDPVTFGFNGEEGNYPDIRKVKDIVYAKQRGAFTKIGVNKFQLNKQGWEIVDLHTGSRIADTFAPLKTLFKTKAWKNYKDGASGAITVDDAIDFYQKLKNLGGEDTVTVELRKEDNTSNRLMVHCISYIVDTFSKYFKLLEA